MGSDIPTMQIYSSGAHPCSLVIRIQPCGAPCPDNIVQILSKNTENTTKVGTKNEFLP